MEQNEYVGGVDVKKAEQAWIGVDLDGTLAVYNGWQGPLHIGEPVWPLVERVKEVLAQGMRVKIFTARVCGPEGGDTAAWLRVVLPAIRDFLEGCGLPGDLEVTNVKDYNCLEIWDDRCRQVVPNSGEFVNERYLEKINMHIDAMLTLGHAGDNGPDTEDVEVTG